MPTLASWSKFIHRIGGLSAIGFDAASRFLLVVSASGRGVFDLRSGARVARDPDDAWTWYHDADATCDGIGPLSGMRIPLYGRGGAVDSPRRLATSTSDGFVSCAKPNRGLPMVVIHLISAGTEIARFEADELRAFGFSSDERVMVIAESSGLIVLCR